MEIQVKWEKKALHTVEGLNLVTFILTNNTSNRFRVTTKKYIIYNNNYNCLASLEAERGFLAQLHMERGKTSKAVKTLATLCIEQLYCKSDVCRLVAFIRDAWVLL